MPVANLENVTLVTTSKDAGDEIRALLVGVSNIENLKIVVATDQQLRDAIARVLWPDPKKVRR